MHVEIFSQENGAELMIELLGVVKHTLIDECDNQFGAFINFPFLKSIYVEHLNMATQLMNATEREKERNNQRQ